MTKPPNQRLEPTWGRRRLAPGDRRLHAAAGRRRSSLAAPHPVRSPLGPTRLKRTPLGRQTSTVKSIPQLDMLCGIRLRRSVAPILEELGLADETSISPPNPDGSVFVNYVWTRLVPCMAVLTWRIDSDEYVWGIRIFGVGPFDAGLGFGPGATRAAVDARLYGAMTSQGDSIRVPLDDGTLIVTLADDVVREIQLLAPLNQAFRPTVEYAESFLTYFSRFANEDAMFEPELVIATRVVALMRREGGTAAGCLDEIVREMRSIDQIPHYDGSGWHGFKNAVRWWLEERGRQLWI